MRFLSQKLCWEITFPSTTIEELLILRSKGTSCIRHCENTSNGISTDRKKSSFFMMFFVNYRSKLLKIIERKDDIKEYFCNLQLYFKIFLNHVSTHPY